MIMLLISAGLLYDPHTRPWAFLELLEMIPSEDNLSWFSLEMWKDLILARVSK